MTTLAPTEYKTQADLARIYRRTLNELPVPAGPWAKTYAERNAKYNRQLAASIVFAIITTIAVRSKTIYFKSWDRLKKKTMSSELNENPSLHTIRRYIKEAFKKINRRITEGSISVKRPR